MRRKPCSGDLAATNGAAITTFDSDTTEQADLRGGRSPWFPHSRQHAPPALGQNLKCEALIVGAGIAGSLIAEALTRQGLDVVIIDRELPARGSTAASTSMLLWEIDVPLTQLAEMIGFERAARSWQASLQAVRGLKSLVAQSGVACELRGRDSLYLAAGETATDLLAEHELRQRARLPGTLLDHKTLLENFGIARAGAILSPDAADADPVLLTHCLLKLAIARGARLFRAEAIGFDAASRVVGVQLEDGHQIEARHVVLATGYVMPDIVQSGVQTVASSWAIATAPQPENLWKDGALIWENKKDYLYARTTATGRIIIGGEDSTTETDPDARDALIPHKSQSLAEKLIALWPRARCEIAYRWAGTFDTTPDGLPLIGPVPRHNRIFATYGYGGNGITFSFLAATLIGGLIGGKSSPLLREFAIQRNVKAMMQRASGRS
ncbi:MAG TPA: FAD-dependent oxidoreductase [Bradyrhizobium sp.]|nr:FAD-dependent oxidoreductase [Bradyrhizobium sp.]